MRFSRRAEGIRSARSVFKRAREDPRISYHVFIAAALIEYFCTKVSHLLLNSKKAKVLDQVFSFERTQM